MEHSGVTRTFRAQVTVAVIGSLVVQPVSMPQGQRSASMIHAEVTVNVIKMKTKTCHRKFSILIKPMRSIYWKYSSKPPQISCNATVTPSCGMTMTHTISAGMSQGRDFWRIIALAWNSRGLGERRRNRGATGFAC